MGSLKDDANGSHTGDTPSRARNIGGPCVGLNFCRPAPPKNCSLAKLPTTTCTIHLHFACCTGEWISSVNPKRRSIAKKFARKSDNNVIMNIAQPISSGVESVEFTFLSPKEIRAISVKRIENDETFDGLLNPVPGGLYDPALGSWGDAP